MLILKKTNNSRAPPGRLEETMRRNNIRIMKMDRNNRSILMRALYADFCANREAGLPYGNLAALITKLHETQPASCRWTMPSTDWPATPSTICATSGSPTVVTPTPRDAALLKLVKAKPRLWPFG